MRNSPYLAVHARRATCKPFPVVTFLCAILLYSCRICYCALVQGDSEQYKGLRHRMVDQQIAASQPYIVALMTGLLEPEKDDVALEVGTGSGYQAAVLSWIVKEVYTVEIIPPLGKAAEKRLKEAAYENIKVKIGDGYYSVLFFDASTPITYRLQLSRLFGLPFLCQQGDESETLPCPDYRRRPLPHHVPDQGGNPLECFSL